MARRDDFDRSVSLPPGLETSAIRRAITYIETQLTDLIDIYYEQANVFSALVGIFGARGLDTFSNYERHRHVHTAQQRFPDLRRRGAGEDPSPNESLESKGSKRPWAVQSHYDHPGWYIIWRYLIDPTGSLELNKSVVVWRVDVAFFEKSDWKYERSSAGDRGGGRTHTFGVKKPAQKLCGKAVYKRADVIIRAGKPIPKNGNEDVDADETQ